MRRINFLIFIEKKYVVIIIKDADIILNKKRNYKNVIIKL